MITSQFTHKKESLPQNYFHHYLKQFPPLKKLKRLNRISKLIYPVILVLLNVEILENTLPLLNAKRE